MNKYNWLNILNDIKGKKMMPLLIASIRLNYKYIQSKGFQTVRRTLLELKEGALQPVHLKHLNSQYCCKIVEPCALPLCSICFTQSAPLDTLLCHLCHHLGALQKGLTPWSSSVWYLRLGDSMLRMLAAASTCLLWLLTVDPSQSQKS